MSKTKRRKTTEAAEDAEDLRYLRKLRSKPLRVRKFEDVIAEIEASRQPTPIRRRRDER